MKRGNEAFAVGTSLPPMSPLGEALFTEGVRRMFEPMPAKQRRAKGRVVTPRGYILIRAPDHPRAHGTGYVFEHVIVAERALGKVLPVSAHVHHVNGDKADNRPSNLVVCEDIAYHMRLHARHRALDACGHADWLRCAICKQWDKPDTMQFLRGARGVHPVCDRAYRLRLRRNRGIMERQSPTHCVRGHLRTPDTVAGDGGCRVCQRMDDRRRRAAKKLAIQASRGVVLPAYPVSE